MTTLTRAALETRLTSHDPEQRLVITPMLSDNQMGDSSIDVRLGNQFIVFRLHALAFYSARDLADAELPRIQERQILSFGQPFVLHPGMLALGSTFEYIAMPGDLECQVEGRSSWARVGLEVATATSVEPGYKGVITLELSNVSATPIELLPGVRIAQLVFRHASPPVVVAAHERKYHCAVGPEFSRLHEDRDMDVLRRFAEGRPIGTIGRKRP